METMTIKEAIIFTVVFLGIVFGGLELASHNLQPENSTVNVVSY